MSPPPATAPPKPPAETTDPPFQGVPSATAGKTTPEPKKPLTMEERVKALENRLALLPEDIKETLDDHEKRITVAEKFR